MTPDIFVYYVDMPVREFVAPCEPCGYSVYISTRLSREGQIRALSHAFRHIQRDDWSHDDVQEIESEAHT